MTLSWMSCRFEPLRAYRAKYRQSYYRFSTFMQLAPSSRETGFRPACRTAEWPRQKQVGQAPSGNRGATRQRVHPEVHREALRFFACRPCKLVEEVRNRETEAVKSYGRLGTFAPLGPKRVGSYGREHQSQRDQSDQARGADRFPLIDPTPHTDPNSFQPILSETCAVPWHQHNIYGYTHHFGGYRAIA